MARFVDAVTDITMQRIVDRVKPARGGRWIRMMYAPVVLASFLIYQTSVALAPIGWRIFYMYVTYLL